MRQISILILILLTFNCKAQENTCAEFKTGRFTYSDPDYADLITIRNDSIQIDTYPYADFETTSRIKWLSACTYEMEYLAVSNPLMNQLIGTKIIIEIIHVEDNKIRCRTVSDGVEVEKEMIKTKLK
jgi:hypothetical protein